MMFFNNPRAAQAILQDRRARMQHVTTERRETAAPPALRRTVRSQLREEPVAPAAAA
jgi:hypothetical protein